MENEICRDFLYKRCKRENCKRIHDGAICLHFWEHGKCKFGDNCKWSHQFKRPERDSEKHSRHSRKTRRNTECFEPMTKPVDMRVVCDISKEHLNVALTTRDVLLAPGVFGDYKPGDIYNNLVYEIENCGVDEEKLLKMWHGNDKIEGTHLIVNDRTDWKRHSPTFNMVIDRIKTFFNMDIQATRFNWYKDTSQWKPFHFDAAAVKPEKAKLQNFTVAVSFGATRDAAFEHADTRTVVSLPQPDGWIYAFAKDTNIIWRHGILQDIPVKNIGRISVIAWGFTPHVSEV